MVDKAKALFLSLVVHLGIVVGALFFGLYPTPETPPLVIDFTMVAVAEEPERIATPEERPHQVDSPASQEKPMVDQRQEAKKPPEFQKKKTPKVKQVKEKTKKHQEQTVQQQEAVPPVQVPVGLEQQLAAVAAEQISDNAPDAVPSTAGQTSSNSEESTETATRAETSKGDNTSNQDYNFEFVRTLIVQNLNFPVTAKRMGLTGKIVVAFLIQADGQAIDISVVTSSGHTILDKAVVATIRRLSPFPKPPTPAKIVLPITFHLE